MIILIHEECGGEVRQIGEDGIDWCTVCETIVEGEPVKSIDTEDEDNKELEAIEQGEGT